MLSWVDHGKSFITLSPVIWLQCFIVRCHHTCAFAFCVFSTYSQYKKILVSDTYEQKIYM